jgi:hypothetical protein
MSQSYVLDTSILLNLIRGHELGRSIDLAFGLRAHLYRHTISIVSHGEFVHWLGVINGGTKSVMHLLSP